MAWLASVNFTAQNPVLVDWGDGASDWWAYPPATHLYADGGRPQITITDTGHGKASAAAPTCPIWDTVTPDYTDWNALQAANATWTDVLSG